ncbi:MAG: RNA methyltransferase [Bacteroidia bacterium]|nr:RNA methyltransferase [Bacteroidia bacterium]
MKSISSLQNPLIKRVVELQSKSRERLAQKLFVVEGLNEIRLCAAAGYQIKELFYCPDIIGPSELWTALGFNWEAEATEVSKPVFEKIAYRHDVRNALALVAYKTSNLSELNCTKNSVYLLAEGIEKPGNIGAMLRTADAMRAEAVILTGKGADLFNPNVIRGSVGCVFTLPVVHCSNLEAQEFFRKNQVNVFTTYMTDAIPSWDISFQGPMAIAVGTESTGLSEEWSSQEYVNVNVPMMGKVDSLNVSVAVSLLLYEARRQNK